MEFINTNLDKGDTKRIELYHKICQITLLVMWIIGMIVAFFLMIRFFGVVEAASSSLVTQTK